jgi:tetratricopeptide (TPR) repeat protein
VLSDLPTASRIAAERGVPVLLLAGYARAHCPPSACVEDGLFSGAELERLARCCVPARLVVGPTYPEGTRAFERYAQGMPLPALLVLSPSGDLLLAQVGQLFGLYDPTGASYEQAPLLTAEQVCARVQDAVARQRVEDARLVTLSASRDPAERLEAAEILLRRRRPEHAALLLSPLADEAVAPEHVARLAEGLRQAGDEPLADRVLAQAVERHPEAPAWRRWTLELRQSLERRKEAVSPSLPTARALLESLATKPDPGLEVLVRLELAEAAATADDAAGLAAQLAWFGDHLVALPADPASAARTLRAWADLAQRRGETAVAVRWYRELLARYPDEPPAQAMKHGPLARLERSLSEKRKD